MGGVQFFWRITLLENQCELGVYRLEEHRISTGAPVPEPVPYAEVSPGLGYTPLIDRLFGCVRKEAGNRVMELTPENPQMELYHDHHMGI